MLTKQTTAICFAMQLLAAASTMMLLVEPPTTTAQSLINSKGCNDNDPVIIESLPQLQEAVTTALTTTNGAVTLCVAFDFNSGNGIQNCTSPVVIPTGREVSIYNEAIVKPITNTSGTFPILCGETAFVVEGGATLRLGSRTIAPFYFWSGSPNAYSIVLKNEANLYLGGGDSLDDGVQLGDHSSPGAYYVMAEGDNEVEFNVLEQSFVNGNVVNMTVPGNGMLRMYTTNIIFTESNDDNVDSMLAITNGNGGDGCGCMGDTCVPFYDDRFGWCVECPAPPTSAPTTSSGAAASAKMRIVSDTSNVLRMISMAGFILFGILQ